MKRLLDRFFAWAEANPWMYLLLVLLIYPPLASWLVSVAPPFLQTPALLLAGLGAIAVGCSTCFFFFCRHTKL